MKALLISPLCLKEREKILSLLGSGNVVHRVDKQWIVDDRRNLIFHPDLNTFYVKKRNVFSVDSPA